MVCFGGGGLSYWMGDRRLGGSLVVAAVTMKPKARTSFSFLADHEIAFPSCRHNFEEKYCRRCSDHCSKHNFEGRRCSLTTSFLGVNKHCRHYLVPSNRNQTTPISLVFCGCSLVIEGEPNRALCRLVAVGG